MVIKKIENISFKNNRQSVFNSLGFNTNNVNQGLIMPPLPKADGGKNKVLVTLAVLGALAAVGVIIYKIGRGRGAEGAGFDTKFKNSVLGALKKEGVNCKKSALDSIVGPEEFQVLIKKYEQQDFARCTQGIIPRFKTKGEYETYLKLHKGTLPAKELEDYYRPILDGKFRVCLHTHSIHSDGAATVNEFLDCATAYANKVAKQCPNDGKPPFMIALTDHDSIDGCKEAIKIIAQNPEKYKNLKFVAGAEFSVKSDISVNGRNNFDLTGLALNPFDEKLVGLMEGLKISRQKTVESLLEGFSPIGGKKYTFNDLVQFQRDGHFEKGKQTIENRAGVVSVRNAIEAFEKITGSDLTEQKNYLGVKDILPIDTVIKAVNENGGFTSLTHPVKSFHGYIGDESLKALKDKGIRGIEACHQYTPSKYYNLGGGDVNERAFAILRQYEEFAHKNDMFISGGTDSHKKQIFSRNPRITSELLARFLA